MRKVGAKELSLAAFAKYGSYAPLIGPKSERIGAPPIEFYRDAIQQGLGPAATASYSTCRVEKRDMVVNVTEYHSSATEGILPLDNDVLIHVGPATRPNTDAPVASIEVFRVPHGTMVVIRPGVWHHAPFTVNDKPANVLIVLPERTYANDCTVVELKKDQQISIEV